LRIIGTQCVIFIRACACIGKYVYTYIGTIAVANVTTTENTPTSNIVRRFHVRTNDRPVYFGYDKRYILFLLLYFVETGASATAGYARVQFIII